MKLACHFYDRHNPNDGVSFYQPGLPFVFARGFSNEYIYFVGNLVDGFFIPTRVTGRIHDDNTALNGFHPYPNQQSLMHIFCKRALKQAFPLTHTNKVLVHQSVKSSHLSLHHYPIVHNNYQRQFDKLVVFGDSLSDQGNLKGRLRFFPHKPYFAGRFSDKEIWVDYLQRMTGIAVQNRAYGGALANVQLYRIANISRRDRLVNKSQLRISGALGREIRRFRRDSLNGGGMINADSTLFSLWIGANDYLPLLNVDGATDIFLDNPDHPLIGSKIVVERVTNSIVAYVEELFGMGAKFILVTNLPDLGRAPRMLKDSSYRRHIIESENIKNLKLSQKVTELITLHNQVLRMKINQLREKYPEQTIILADITSAERNIINSIHLDNNYSFFNYDFDLNFQKQFIEGEKRVIIHSPCITRKSFRTTGKICAEPQRVMFWDDLHPTSYGHCLIANFLHQQFSRAHMLSPVSTEKYLHLCRPELPLLRNWF